jgi:hypothetical protein
MPNTLISQQSKNLSGVLPYLKHPDSNQYSDSRAVSKNQSINKRRSMCMSETLKQLFPNIRTEEAIIGEIKSDENLLAEYESWTELQQGDFLKFCSGMRGVKVLYDGFGKEILSPIYHPERLEELLSCILETEVKIRQVIPSDGTRIADEQSLVIMDIVVELMDGSLANVEIQRIGYLFPGERCACYSADLLLRQYKSVKSRKKRNFTYRDVKNVYTIVFIEKSTKEFQEFPNTYIHRAKQQFDTGLSVNLLQEYVLVPLDIFRKTTHNKIIENKLDAWLTFLSNDTSEKVKELVEKYPEFRDMYQEIYDICENVEEVVRMFSKELQELDRNTVKFMIEEQEREIKAQKEQLRQSEEELQKSQEQLKKNEEELQRSQEQLKQSEEELQKNQEQLKQNEEELQKSQEQLAQKDAQIARLLAQIEEKDT